MNPPHRPTRIEKEEATIDFFDLTIRKGLASDTVREISNCKGDFLVFLAAKVLVEFEN